MTTGGAGRRIVLATANPDKAREISDALAGLAVELIPRPASVPDVDESGATLLENARLKAYALRAATGEDALADDTGLEVDALGGAPGVHSARYAGEPANPTNNIARLLRELDGVAPNERTARFVTVALARFVDGREVVTRGEVEGTITVEPSGGAGFGYDPVFRPREGDGRTFAEMGPEEKHALSHRGRAFRALAAALGD